MSGAGVERPLAGGVDQAGAVVQVGATVRRPGGVNADAVRLLLSHLDRAGFRGAPRFLGLDRQGREILDFLAGDVAIPPYPDWAADDDLLVSVAELQRDLHAAAAGFALPAKMAWTDRRLPPGAAGDLVCHTDLCLENVVVRGGRAAAFIDFDLALPVDRLFDVAVAARHWVPLRDPADIADARRGAALFDRFGRFTGVHGLGAVGRDRVFGLLIGFLDVSLDEIRAAAAAGHPGYAAIWAGGYEAMNRRSLAWLIAHRADLTGARSAAPD
jgi:hypothetical protein